MFQFGLRTLIAVALAFSSVPLLRGDPQFLDTTQQEKDDKERLAQAAAPAGAESGARMSLAAADATSGDARNLLYPFENDGTWTQAMPRNDDGSSGPYSLPFTFPLYGDNYTRVWINNNGNLSFVGPYGAYTSTGFPSSSFVMVAPFWADVDTRAQRVGTGLVWYKFLDANNDGANDSLVVTWDNVGYYSYGIDKTNTFQVVICNGTNPRLGIGNTVCFSYDVMAWTTGSASGGSGGFGGTPATVGCNRGNGVDFVQLGRFNHAGTDYDGPFGNADGVGWLNGQVLCVNTGAAVGNVPPVAQGLPEGNVVQVDPGGAPLDLTVRFLSPEIAQTTTVTIDDPDGAQTAGLTIQNTPGNLASVRLAWAPACPRMGTYVLTMTASDNYTPPGVTTVALTIQVGSDCNANRLPDSCDILEGRSQDLDGNGIPDVCAGNLIVTSVDVQGTAAAGRPLHVAWNVRNNDPAATVRYTYSDVVYLSSDAQWDINDTRLAAVPHGTPVDPQQSYHAETDVIVPGVLPGSYHILVRTDHLHAPAGHVMAVPVSVDVEELVLGSPASAQFTQTERTRYYRVNVAEGEDLRVILDDLDDTGWNELYVSREAVPTRSQFQYLNPFSFVPDQTITVPGTTAGTYYILAYAADIPAGAPASFTLKAEYVPLQVTRVTPDHGGNAGQVTVAIAGARLTLETVVRLIASDGQQRQAANVYFENSTSIGATFDLVGAAAGTYDLFVDNGRGATVSVANAFRIEQGGSPLFQARIVAPPAVRGFGSSFTFYIEYENQGTVDMPAPLLVVETNVPFWLDGHPETRTTSIQLMGISMSGPAGILRPGTTERIRLWSTAPAQMKLRSVTTSDVPINWAGMYAGRRPPFLDEAYWNAHWEEVLRGVGTNWRDYLSTLASQATRLASTTGTRYFLAQDLYVAAVREATDNPDAPISFAVSLNLSAPVWTYQRTAAINDANIYAFTVCPDGIYWTSSTRFITKAPGTLLSTFVLPDPNGYGNDCAHFISACLISGRVPIPISTVGTGELDTFLLSPDANGNTYGDTTTPLVGGDVIRTPHHRKFYLGGNLIAEHSGGSTSTYPGYGTRTSGGSFTGIHIKDTIDDEDDDDTDTTGSYDPNDKVSLAGWGERRFVALTEVIPYAVYFENVPEATAAAMQVRVTDRLDPALDWTTLELDEIAFGGAVIRVPRGLSHYEGQVAFDGWTWSSSQDWHRGETPLRVNVVAGINIATGELTCMISSIDPATGNPPTDAYAGFLPPDREDIAYPAPTDPGILIHPGEGSLTYRVRARSALATGTEIRNRATIIFDTNDPIDTPEALNSIDRGAPSSRVAPLPAETTEALVGLTWTGEDDAGGCGIANYEIYVSVDDAPFRKWKTTSETSDSFPCDYGHRYSFYSVAVDNVGNREAPPATPDATITVRNPNEPPEVGAITAPAAPAPINTAVNVTAPFTDPDASDAHTATWDWGDGSTSAGTVTEANGSGSVAGSHAYSVPGIYTLNLTVADNEGASDQAVFQYVVVYDPAGGFVTGGGWIDSPAEAYAADPALTGRANFGFVSKYQRGTTVPTGQTQFQFQVADLNFHSTAYQWLVVSGARAQFKGTGTINGEGDFGFLLSAIDGQLSGGGGTDKFRIKIWDKVSGQVVYDNQIGSTDDAAPSTVIGGGSIVIHKP